MPRFSIVIPTRNRAHLLKDALQSSLQQTLLNYEIVVSDNDSQDDTPAVVKSFNDPRIRYFRTPKTLSMPDNWEFGLNQTQGEWVTILQDRALLSKELLQTVADALVAHDTQLVSWASASYVADSWHETKSHNQLIIFPYSGRTLLMNSQEILSRLFSRFYGHNSQPVMLNSFCRRSLIQAVKAELGGRFFLPTCPDFTSCVAMLALTKSYLFLDLPLRVAALTKESIGASSSHNRSEVTLNCKKEYGDEPLYRCVPMKIYVMDNCISDSILRVKERMPILLKDFHLNWRHYFVRCYTQLQHLAWQKVDVSDEKHEFFQVLSQYPLKFQAGVYASMLAKGLPIYGLRKQIRSLVDRFGFLVNLDQMLRKTPGTLPVVRGAEAGFHDSRGALAYLDRILRKDSLRNPAYSSSVSALPGFP